MTSQLSFNPSETARVHTASFWIGLMALAYAALSVAYFHTDFFQYLHCGATTEIDQTGILVHVQGPIWSVLSLWRVLGATVAVGMLGASAVQLWKRAPRARVFALLSLWGIFLPQLFWYTEFSTDWHQGQYLTSIPLLAIGAVAIPTALLLGRGMVRKFEGRDTLTGWANLSYGRFRLLFSAIALSWLAFGAINYLDHSLRLPSSLAYSGAFMAVILSGVSVVGLLRLRSWALWVGVGAALALALVPLAALWTPYVPNYGSFLNETVQAVANNDLQRTMWALLPLSVIWLIAGPFLHAFLRKLKA